MRTITEISQDNKPIIFLGSCLSMPNIIESCWAASRDIAGIIDDDYSSNTTLHGLPLLSSELLNKTEITSSHEFFVATGWNPGKNSVTIRNNKKREQLLETMKNKHLLGATLIHPSAIVSPLARFGRNVRVGALTMITAGAQIHDNVNVKEQCYVSHGVIIDNDSIVQLKATITGDVHIGKKTYIGIGSTIINRSVIARPMKIGDNVLVHPGITVLQSLPNDSIASLQNPKFSRVF